MLDLEFRKYLCEFAGDVKKVKFKIQNDIHFWILTYKMQLLVVFEGLVPASPKSQLVALWLNCSECEDKGKVFGSLGSCSR